MIEKSFNFCFYLVSSHVFLTEKNIIPNNQLLKFLETKWVGQRWSKTISCKRKEFKTNGSVFEQIMSFIGLTRGCFISHSQSEILVLKLEMSIFSHKKISEISITSFTDDPSIGHIHGGPWFMWQHCWLGICVSDDEEVIYVWVRRMVVVAAVIVVVVVVLHFIKTLKSKSLKQIWGRSLNSLLCNLRCEVIRQAFRFSNL